MVPGNLVLWLWFWYWVVGRCYPTEGFRLGGWLCVPGWPLLSSLLGSQVSSKTSPSILTGVLLGQASEYFCTGGGIARERAGLSLALGSWPEVEGLGVPARDVD